jgi:formamidopyrimidine-DNA glycosylase
VGRSFRNLRWPIPRDLSQRRQEPIAIRRRESTCCSTQHTGTSLVHLDIGRFRSAGPAHASTTTSMSIRRQPVLRLRIRGASAMLWASGPAERHAPSAGQGGAAEPAFNGEGSERARGRRVAVKHFLMNTRIVTGVGNICAS